MSTLGGLAAVGEGGVALWNRWYNKKRQQIFQQRLIEKRQVHSSPLCACARVRVRVPNARTTSDIAATKSPSRTERGGAYRPAAGNHRLPLERPKGERRGIVPSSPLIELHIVEGAKPSCSHVADAVVVVADDLAFVNDRLRMRASCHGCR